MAAKPTLSPSKITTYLACPVQYRWTYLDRRARWYLRSKSYYSFGTTLHNVLQRFHDSDDAGVTTTEQAVAALEESWIEAGYGSQEEMSQALHEGKAIVERYVEAYATAPVTAKTLLVEKALRWDMGPFVLLGRLDRLDELEDGTLEVVDYKSGREHVSEDDVRFDLAMACYQLLVRRHYPDKQVQAAIVALRSGQKAVARMDEAEMAEFEADLVRLGEEIIHRDFVDVVPVAKALCPQCDFLPLCQRHDAFELRNPRSAEAARRV